MTEKEERIVNYLANKVGTSIDKMEENASNMLKYITGILTVLIALATFFKVEAKYVVAPIMFFIIGIIGFIKTVQLKNIEYIVGEIDSSVDAYEKMVLYKNKWLKIGYYCSYIGFACFIFIILA